MPLGVPMSAFRHLVLLLLVAAPALSFAEEAAPARELPHVTISFEKADLSHVLYYLFFDTGLRYEAPKDAGGSITATLEEVPFDKALRLLLEPHGFSFTREGDLYRVTRREEFAQVTDQLRKERLERERRYWIRMSQRPLPITPPRQVRYLEGPAYGLAAPAYPGPLLFPYPPASAHEPQRSFRLGPLSIPIPSGLRLLPGGGWEVTLPAEGGVEWNGLSFPAPATGGLTFGRK